MAAKHPSEAARDTLKLLASRKLAPTPANFASIYHEIAGSKPNEDALEAFKASFSGADAFDPHEARRMVEWIQEGKWDRLFDALRQAQDRARPAGTHAQPEAASAGRSGQMALVHELREQIARTIEFCLPALGEDDARIGPDAAALAEACRAESECLASLNTKLAAFNHRLSFAAEDQSEIRQSLLGMLRLVFENIGELSLDDRWLHGQIEALMKASEAPVSLRRLDDVRSRLKDVILKQSELKARTIEAQEDMKRLLASFMERLSSLAELSGEHHCHMEACAKKIESATMISEIAPAIQEALSATRWISLEAARNRDELSAMKRKAEEAATEAARLRKELDLASASARHDLQTGALNRKGLEEALEREVAGVARKGSPLSIAFLDVDNFKSINDLHGHLAGDDALAHLAQVARESMRPQDTLARFGGEEFVVLMPDTALEDGVRAMTRLQRALTRRFFMTGSAKLVITFSAGVTELGRDESPMAAIQRADRGMYQAKRAGKNKVVGV
ncbi:GGDEF domain-containing protein [uncultured Ralstonia sp.]|jgi:diguanylate cyclase|uniref:GGDEF domain-containing protein n=1 Tax=uncultured Ralstonia sp. TaxID=114715 RepID=UPI001EAB3798|nr:GGDEF domain-containing protein [uncultured Ralstonia sp.]UCF23493.1 MAG: GGDEF domain-containing protein [Ralstonia sp.]